MDYQHDFARRFLDIGDDVGDQGAQELLARAHGHPGRVPSRAEIIGKTGEVGRHDDGIGRAHCLQSCLAGLDAAQRRLPALLELRGDQRLSGSQAA